MKEDSNGKTAKERFYYVPDFWRKSFEPSPRAKKKRPDWRSKLEDIALLFDPHEDEKEGPEDGSDLPYGKV